MGLNFENCLITSLPESFSNLSNLAILELQNNQLTSLPEDIGNIGSENNGWGYYLRLHNNQLTSLPESICDLGINNWGDEENNAYTLFNNYICPFSPPSGQIQIEPFGIRAEVEILLL